jgi:hypothetical protein
MLKFPAAFSLVSPEGFELYFGTGLCSITNTNPVILSFQPGLKLKFVGTPGSNLGYAMKGLIIVGSL